MLDNKRPANLNEHAKKLELSCKYAQRILMHLAFSKDDGRYKNSGRIYMFWKIG